MKFLEKDLEDIIYNNFETCIERGLKITNYYDTPHLLRQVRLYPYGVADLISIDFCLEPIYGPFDAKYQRAIRVTIMECKQVEVNAATYLQANRYRHALRRIFKQFNLRRTAIYIDLALIGRTIDTKSDFTYLLNMDSGCDVYLYDFDMNGISFRKLSKDWRHKGENEEEFRRTGMQVKQLFIEALDQHDDHGIPYEIETFLK